MSKRPETNQPKTVEIVRTTYQPKKREKEETLRTQVGFEQAVDAVLRPVRIKWVDRP